MEKPNGVGHYRYGPNPAPYDRQAEAEAHRRASVEIGAVTKDVLRSIDEVEVEDADTLERKKQLAIVQLAEFDTADGEDNEHDAASAHEETM